MEKEKELTPEEIEKIVLHLSLGEKMIWASSYASFRNMGMPVVSAIKNSAEEVRLFRTAGNVEFKENDPNYGNKYYDDMIEDKHNEN